MTEKEKLRTQAVVLNALYADTPNSTRNGWVHGDSIRELAKRLYPGLSSQAINGGLVSLENVGLVKYVEMHGATAGPTGGHWKLTATAERVQALYDPEILIDVMNRAAEIMDNEKE